MAWSNVGSSKEYYSHTQINMMRRCGYQYYLRYVMGHKQKPTGPLILGSAVHTGAETNFISKFKKKKPASLDACMNAFGEKFDDTKSGVDFLGKKPGMVKDTGYKMTEAHYTKLAPLVTPLELPEKKYQFKIEGVSKPILVIIDLIGKTASSLRRVIDLKTAGRKKTRFEVDMDDQLTMYELGEKTSGNPPKDLAFHVLLPTGETQSIVTRRNEAKRQGLVASIKTAEKMIKAGDFLPTSNAMTCSWCGYRDLCPTAGGGRKK